MPAPLSRESNGTERITVVMTPAQKRTLQQRARRAGMTVSDYIRRQALDGEDLGPLVEQLRASTALANQALDNVFRRLHSHAKDVSLAEAAARASARRTNAT